MITDSTILPVLEVFYFSYVILELALLLQFFIFYL